MRWTLETICATGARLLTVYLVGLLVEGYDTTILLDLKLHKIQVNLLDIINEQTIEVSVVVLMNILQHVDHAPANHKLENIELWVTDVPWVKALAVPACVS